jgi:serine O-acetyltransferase
MFISPFHVLQTDLPKLSKPHTRGCARSVLELRLLLRADLWRYEGNGRAKWLKLFLFNPGYRYTALMRITGYLKTDRFNRFTLYPVFKMILLRQRHILGMAIAEYADIGPGLFVTRFGGIYINGDCIIGANVNLSPMILFGQTNRGATIGSPVIGNRVFVASGARITGPITIGSDVAVAANAVVVKSDSEGAVLAGIPAKRISDKGSAGYINRQVPDDMLRACAVERRKQGGPEAVWYPADMLNLGAP